MILSFEQFQTIVSALAVILGAVITYIVRPYIKAKITETQQNNLENWIKKSIKAAEQIYTPDQWKEKKDAVLTSTTELLNSGKIKVDITEEQLDMLIEGLVNEIKKNPENKITIEQK